MLEQQPPINDSADYVVTMQCGCTVTFMGSCFHRSSRMSACVNHCLRDQFDVRTKIVQMAKEELAWRKQMQPPR